MNAVGQGKARAPLRLCRDRRGAGVVEYALLLVAILLVVAAGYQALSGRATKVTGVTTVILGGGDATLASGNGGAAPPTPGLDGSDTGGPLGAETSASVASVFNSSFGCTGTVCTSPGNCFVEGTPVWTPAGERPIEAIAAGDVVLSRDERSGTVRARRVARTFTRRARSLVDVTLVGGDGARETVRATPEHRIWSEGRGWVEAKDLGDDDRLVDLDGRVVRVASVVDVPVEAVVYNFEVEGTHTYFVGALGTWVHNACDPIKPVFNSLSGPSIPSVSSQTVSNALGNTLPANGVGTYTINPSTGAISPATAGTGSWFGGSPTFSGQYIGLLTPPNGNAPHTVDPNADVVFTDNLTGCAVAISQSSPPQMLHMLCSNLGGDPASYQAAIGPTMTQAGMNPDGNMPGPDQAMTPANYPPPIVVTANDYGWTVGGGDYGGSQPSAHNSQAFLYGYKDPATGQRQWWLLTVGHNADGTEYVKSSTLVGTTRP